LRTSLKAWQGSHTKGRSAISTMETRPASIFLNIW
jgi:hypothetical protein